MLKGYLHGLVRPLSETQRNALRDMESIWLRFAGVGPSLGDCVDLAEVQAVCQIVASHHLWPAYVTIASIECSHPPLLIEFFDELLKLPTTQGKTEQIEQVKTAWMEQLHPMWRPVTAKEAMQVMEAFGLNAYSLIEAIANEYRSWAGREDINGR